MTQLLENVQKEITSLLVTLRITNFQEIKSNDAPFSLIQNVEGDCITASTMLLAKIKPMLQEPDDAWIWKGKIGKPDSKNTEKLPDHYAVALRHQDRLYYIDPGMQVPVIVPCMGEATAKAAAMAVLAAKNTPDAVKLKVFPDAIAMAARNHADKLEMAIATATSAALGAQDQRNRLDDLRSEAAKDLELPGMAMALQMQQAAIDKTLKAATKSLDDTAKAAAEAKSVTKAAQISNATKAVRSFLSESPTSDPVAVLAVLAADNTSNNNFFDYAVQFADAMPNGRCAAVLSDSHAENICHVQAQWCDDRKVSFFGPIEERVEASSIVPSCEFKDEARWSMYNENGLLELQVRVRLPDKAFTYSQRMTKPTSAALYGGPHVIKMCLEKLGVSQLLREDVEKTLKRGFLKPDDLFATTATKPATEARAIFATRSEVLDMIFALSPSIITAKDDEATETVAWLPETPDCLYHMVGPWSDGVLLNVWDLIRFKWEGDLVSDLLTEGYPVMARIFRESPTLKERITKMSLTDRSK